MHLLPLLNVLGVLLMVFGGAQLLPMATALAYGEADWTAFLYSGAAAALAGGLLWVLARNAQELTERDGFSVVTLGWVAAGGVGAIPYLLTGTVPSFTDAVFESVSGFTTTGASVLIDYGRVGHGMFLWRSLTQWLGGMGIIVLALVILPALGIGGMQLYKREVPGPYSEKLTPRLRDTARALWSVYLVLTVAETLVLKLLGMNWFEAVNHALTTVSTGGFSTRGASVGGFADPAIEWAIVVFMFLGGMNFSLHYGLLLRPTHRGRYFGDLEWRWYVAAGVGFSAVVSAYLFLRQGYDGFAAVSKGTFQVVSIMTTTGFGSADYAVWGAFPQLILVLLMLTGGCAGSTAGGIKIVRILLLFKFVRIELVRLIHPRVVIQVKVRNTQVTGDILGNVFAFIFLYFTILGMATLLIALDGNDFLTSLGAATSAIGNVGPGLAAVGPVENYAGLSPAVKWVLVTVMLLGRLEVMTVLALLMPRVWRS